MELSTFATIIGTLELVAAIPLLLVGPAASRFFITLCRNDLFMRIAGAVTIIITVLVLRQGMRIGTDAAGLIRLIAWIGFLKGIIAAWRPRILVDQCERFLPREGLRALLGILGILIAVLLLWGSTLV
jgi:hypothetical protein